MYLNKYLLQYYLSVHPVLFINIHLAKEVIKHYENTSLKLDNWKIGYKVLKVKVLILQKSGSILLLQMVKLELVYFIIHCSNFKGTL